MGTFSPIDFSKLPAPDLVTPLSAEDALADILDLLKQKLPDLSDALSLETEPLVKFSEVLAYIKTLLDARANTVARGAMLAFATGNDLDNLAAAIPLTRRLVSPGDPDAVPPVPPAWETDDEFRLRIAYAPAAYSVAGPVGAYIFHARDAHPNVKDAWATTPTPGVVEVYVLSSVGGGVPGQAVLDAVQARLDNDNVRPIGDSVTVLPATVTNYTVAADLTLKSDAPDAAIMQAAALAAVQAYADAQYGLNRPVTLAGLYAALMVEGVQNATITSPPADLPAGATAANFMTGLSVTVGGVP